MIEEYLNTLSQYFITPEAFVLGLGLLAIIIFYLKKPKPQEQLMPSIEFFMKDKADGKLNSILQRLKNNILLLLHLLIFTLIILAVAEPFQLQEGDQDHRIHVLDNSANSHNQLNQHKEYLTSKLGESNTIIKASNNEIIAENVDAPEAEKIIEEQKIEYNKPKLHESIRTAREYDGEIIIASTFGGEEPVEIEQELAGLNQEYKFTEPSFQNKWGITNVKRTSQQEFRITIRNYMQETSETEIRHNDKAYDLNIDPESSEKITLKMEEGTNTIELEEDQFDLDNNAYINYNKGNKKAAVNLENSNEYVKTALEVQNSIGDVEEFENNVPGDADLTISDQKLDNNRSQIIYKPEKEYFDGSETSEVSLKGGNPIKLGTVSYKKVSEDFEGLSNPKDVVYREKSSEDTVYINFEGQELENKPVYPLIWREALDNLLDTSEPYFKASKVGIEPGITEGKHVNLLLTLNPFEQTLEKSDYNEIGETKRSYQKELTALTLLLLFLEIAVLKRRGVI